MKGMCSGGMGGEYTRKQEINTLVSISYSIGKGQETVTFLISEGVGEIDFRLPKGSIKKLR